MPDNNKSKKNPESDKFVKNNPQYQDFFDANPIPEPATNKEVKYKDTKSIQPFKDPFTGKPFYPVLGSAENIKREDVFPIDTDDSGKSIMYGTYTQPRTKDAIPEYEYLPTTYRQIEGENASKVFYPSTNLARLSEGNNPYSTRTSLANYDLLKNPNINPLYNKDNQLGEEKELTQPTDSEPDNSSAYSDVNKNSNVYTRRLSKVIPVYDGKTQVETPEGIVFKEPGWKFYKVFEDGVREEVGENDYQVLKKFNTLPSSIKNKYVEEFDTTNYSGKNKEIADNKMALLQNIGQK